MYGGGQQGYGRGGPGMGMGFGPPVTPPIIKNLLIINAATFVAAALIPSIQFLGAVVPVLVWQGGYLWQPFTYMWLHGSLGHIAMNMFVLWMFGSPMAMAWGAKRFLRYYLVCGTGAGVFIATAPYILLALGIDTDLGVPTVGASGAVYAVVLAYSLTWPDRTIMLIFPPVAFRAIWIIPVMFFMTVAMGGGNVSHIGHLGGVVVGWLLLRRDGPRGGQPLTVSQLRKKWDRYRMKRRLRAVRQQNESGRAQQSDKRPTYH
ncbi:rhomboid family intramembrane serine protease [Myxococcota bacterium]|nr:rhomboid family intramembrane serine protease [Myxococcota bacterium]